MPGFKDNKIMVGAVMVDYCFQPNWNKFFISTGVEYLSENLAHEQATSTSNVTLR
jgi:predicted Mrr-cat superfamily restriction endonuclease